MGNYFYMIRIYRHNIHNIRDDNYILSNQYYLVKRINYYLI